MKKLAFALTLISSLAFGNDVITLSFEPTVEHVILKDHEPKHISTGHRYPFCQIAPYECPKTISVTGSGWGYCKGIFTMQSGKPQSVYDAHLFVSSIHRDGVRKLNTQIPRFDRYLKKQLTLLEEKGVCRQVKIPYDTRMLRAFFTDVLFESEAKQPGRRLENKQLTAFSEALRKLLINNESAAKQLFATYHFIKIESNKSWFSKKPGIDFNAEQRTITLIYVADDEIFSEHQITQAFRRIQ